MKLEIEGEEYINRTFRLNKKLVHEMLIVCDDRGISLNKLVDICIRYALEHLERDGIEQKNE